MAMNSRQSQSIDEEFRLRLKHQALLQEFLELQKDFISKKKKMQIAEKKRDTLLAEFRFLRQKHRCLMNLHSSNIQTMNELLPPVKQDENVESMIMVKKVDDTAACNKRIKIV